MREDLTVLIILLALSLNKIVVQKLDSGCLLTALKVMPHVSCFILPINGPRHPDKANVHVMSVYDLSACV